MRIFIVGAGSTGGLFGARLAQAGRDVTFLVRPARAAALRAHGLQVTSPLGDFTIAPQLVLAQEIAAPYDVVLITVKAYSLDAALADVAPAVGPNTMILPVLNGMRHLDTLVGQFGAHSVLGCACKVATVIDRDGRIVQLNTMQELIYGELDGTITPRVTALDTLLNGAGFTATLSRDIALEMWEKWIMLATLGGVTCLTRGNVGAVLAAPDGAEFARRFLEEVVTTVRALGHEPRASFVESLTKRLTEKDSAWTSSMYRDLQHGQPVEADQILGDLLKRARSVSVPTPLLMTAYTHLSVYEATRIAARTTP
jgi:2-dehydropantoate 2-reductase